MHWRGKVCVVTGASSGFGRQAAAALAERGATVVAVARRKEMLESLVADLGGSPHSYVVCDVGDLDQIRKAAVEIEEKAGRIDVLVNNAGIASSGPLSATTSERMERVIRTNLLGAIFCTKEWLHLLEAAPKEARTPVVVNVASMAGRIPVPRSGDYVASKFGLVGFTEASWIDLKELGIKSLVVNPGPADTEGFPMDEVRANPITAWTVMDASRVASAIVRGVERGAMEVRVQWWFHPLYYFSVLVGPARRFIAEKVAGEYGRVRR